MINQTRIKQINKQHIIKNIIYKIFTFISKLIKCILVLIFTLITFYTICHLIELLTNSKSKINNSNNTPINLFTGVPTYDMINDMLYDGLLVTLFIIQHSFMATNFYKSFFKSSSFLFPLQRSIYNLFTSITIEIMISNWRSIDSFLIWDLTKYESILSTMKIIVLFIILLEFIIFLNFFEFFGIAQVWSDCIKNKEYELPIVEKNRLYSVMRHPNTVTLLIIVWFSSSKMTLDLFTLCTFFTFYLLSGNSKVSQKQQPSKLIISKTYI